jgi:hypothetical protein
MKTVVVAANAIDVIFAAGEHFQPHLRHEFREQHKNQSSLRFRNNVLPAAMTKLRESWRES